MVVVDVRGDGLRLGEGRWGRVWEAPAVSKEGGEERTRVLWRARARRAGRGGWESSLVLRRRGCPGEGAPLQGRPVEGAKLSSLTVGHGVALKYFSVILAKLVSYMERISYTEQAKGGSSWRKQVWGLSGLNSFTACVASSVTESSDRLVNDESAAKDAGDLCEHTILRAAETRSAG